MNMDNLATVTMVISLAIVLATLIYLFAGGGAP
jgi:hypothetical protein